MEEDVDYIEGDFCLGQLEVVARSLLHLNGNSVVGKLL